ncbi:MAG: hypothetical protein U0872_07540 [Planctomycetaceae bacterium]
MHAWIVAGLLVAWSGAAPAPVGNQPRPQIAQPLPHGVIGVVYTFPSDTDDECEQRLELKHRDLNVYQFSRESDNGCADSISATGFEILLVKDEDGTLNSDDLTISVPPAPLPERVEDCVQVFATLPESPESCHDSDGHPPAPPAESGHCVPAVMPPHPALGTPAGLLTGYKIRLFRNENSTDAFPPPIVQKLGAEALPAEPTEPRPIPGVLTKDRLKHVQAAIQHLEAAGMTEAARRLREQSREAMTLLRQEQRRHLHEKEEELLRLSEEIEQLKTELASDAAIEFRLEHFTVNSALLSHVSRSGHADLRAAARMLSAGLNPTLRAASKLPPHPDHQGMKDLTLARALHLLQESGVIHLRSAPRLRTRSGETVHLVVGNGAEAQDRDGARHLTHTNFAVHEPTILPDGRIQAEVNYEIATEDKVVKASDSKALPHAENMKVVHQVQLTSGQTAILGGISANGRARGVTGVSHERRVELITITATLTEIEAVPDDAHDGGHPDGINSAETDDCEPEEAEIQPSSSTEPTPGRKSASREDAYTAPAAATPSPPNYYGRPAFPQYAPAAPVMEESPVFQLIPSPTIHGRVRLMVPMTPVWAPSFVPIPPSPADQDSGSPEEAPIPGRTNAEEDENQPPVA